VNKKALKSKMALVDYTWGALAKALGITPTTLSAKINETNGAEFTQGEILFIKERYNLTANEVVEIFFTDEVS
jgi:hypothetical protein